LLFVCFWQVLSYPRYLCSFLVTFLVPLHSFHSCANINSSESLFLLI
jgi:predicted permease